MTARNATARGSAVTVHGSAVTVHGSAMTVHGSAVAARGSAMTVHGSTVAVHGSAMTVHGHPAINPAEENHGLPGFHGSELNSSVKSVQSVVVFLRPRWPAFNAGSSANPRE